MSISRSITRNVAKPVARPISAGANQAPPGSPIPTQAPVIAASNGGQHPSTLSVISTAVWTNNPTSKSYQWMKGGNPYGSPTTTPQSVASDGAGSYKLTEYASNAANPNAPNYSNSNTIAISAAATVPAQMAAPALTAGTNSIAVDRANSTADGGSAITRYDLRYGTDGTNYTVAEQTTDPQTITGLTGGATYRVSTRAVNAVGAGPWSTDATATPVAAATAPAQMAAPSLTAGNQSIAVTRAAAPSDGGSAITGYDILYRAGSSGAFTVVAMTTNPQTLTGLTNGQAYEVTTRAVNAIGNGPASTAATATPAAGATAPAKMAAPALSASTTSIVVNREDSPADGGSPITRYDLRYGTDGVNYTVQEQTEDPLVVNGLTRATTYRVSTRAVNAVGPGPWSDDATITTQATTPGAMGAPSVTAGDQSASVTRGADPADNGGSPITGYQLLYRVGSSGSYTIVAMTANPQTVTGLVNGTSYEFRTRAANAQGNGPISPATNATPVAAAAYDTDAQNYFNAMTVQPSDTRKGQIDTLVKGLKTDGVWAKLDSLFLLAAETAQGARVNAKTPSKSLSAVNSPAFTASRGYTGNATDAYLDFGEPFAFSGANYVLDSASIFYWCNLGSATVGLQGHIGNTGASRANISARNNAGNNVFALNDTTSTAYAGSGIRTGFRSASRGEAATRRIYNNGSLMLTATVTSTAVSATNGCALRSTSAYTDDRFAVAGAGGNLTDADNMALYNRINTFLTAIGAN